MVAMLHLIRAAKSRPSGTWSDDDYDVFEGEQHSGRLECRRALDAVLRCG